MTRINLTLSEDTLHHLISGDDKGISMLLREALNQILEHQRTDQIEAARYERTETRQGLRNGYKPRKLNSELGHSTCAFPRYGKVYSPQSCSKGTNVVSRPWSLPLWK